MKTLLVNFIADVIIKHFVSRIFLGLILFGLTVLCAYLIETKLKIPIDKKIYSATLLYFFSAGILFRIFNIGEFLIKKGLIVSGISLLIYYGLSKLFFWKYSSVFSITISVFLLICYSFKNYFFKSRDNFKLKTLTEVDSFGNGDTYQKGRLFEDYVASIYKALGNNAMTTTEMRQKNMLPGLIQKRGGSGEQGVDVVIFDKNNERIVIQCKHYSSKVSNSAVQEIVASMPLYKANRGIVITNQYFTEPAKELALANKITLIDRDGLSNLINKVNNLKNKDIKLLAS